MTTLLSRLGRLFLCLSWLVAAAPAAWADTASGSIATHHGAGFEQTIQSMITRHGFRAQPHRQWVTDGQPDGDWLLTNAPYTTLYGSPGRTEFLLLSPARHLQVRIEAKWQQSPGSVDEKLPHLYLNAVHAMPERQVIIVIDGPGWRPGGLAWLRHAAQDRRYVTDEDKDVRVMSMAEFQVWVHDRLESEKSDLP